MKAKELADKIYKMMIDGELDRNAWVHIDYSPLKEAKAVNSILDAYASPPNVLWLRSIDDMKNDDVLRIRIGSNEV